MRIVRRWRVLFGVALFLTLLFLSSQLSYPTSQAQPGWPPRVAGEGWDTEANIRKIHPKLRQQLAQAAPSEEVQVIARVKAGTDLSPYMQRLVVRPFVDPLGQRAVIGTAKAGLVAKIASLPGVAFLQPVAPIIEPPRPPDPDVPGVTPSREAIQKRLAEIRSGARRQPPLQREPDADKAEGWFDVLDNHKSKAAWEKGFTGSGVKVMVNDSGIDFAHPDLQGTWATIDDLSSPYFGWPEMFDSYSMFLYALDQRQGTSFIVDGLGDYADTSTTCNLRRCRFQPIGASQLHLYKLPDTSRSGVFHIGNHPDRTLQELWYDERVAVLVVDEKQPSVYDTVYIDLNHNLDFTDDKPARRDDPLSFADLDGDGYADLSGGLVYFIADGVNPVPASDWLWGLGVAGNGQHDFGEPAKGSLVAFAIDDFTGPAAGHGTLTSSNVAAQGIIDGRPSADGLDDAALKPSGDGTPGTGIVLGGGKDVQLVSNGDSFLSPFVEDAFLFSALGYDGIPGTDDDVPIVSNSWGCSDVDNDGWDSSFICNSRLIDLIMRFLGPSMSVLVSTGNGGPGYGTIAPPTPPVGISVGASTQMGSTGWDSATSIEQITHGDVIPFSNRGPGARGDVGPHVVASGAFAAGDIPLNAWGDGWTAWVTWGGTSRSAPVAAGNLALVYDAYRQRFGTWPDTLTARAILMAGADNVHYDPFVQGAGRVNADRATDIAGGLGSFYTFPDQWQVGDYRGEEFPGFANLMRPGQTDSQTFIVVNTGSGAKTISLQSDALVKTGERTFDWTTSDISQEDPYDFNRPGYLREITADIPPGTDLLVVRAIFPYGEWDPEQDYEADQGWRLLAYDWTDVNNTGRLWSDANGNQTVNGAELEKGEYMRFSYHHGQQNNKVVLVQRPLERMHDGVFIGLQHQSSDDNIPVTHFQVRLEFYRHQPWPWLSLSTSSLAVDGDDVATFGATVRVPRGTPPGAYEAAIRLNDGEHESVLPVVVNVAADVRNPGFGGEPPANTPYDNSLLSGAQDWGWRAEAGDWRFFFLDLPSEPLPPSTGRPFQRWWFVDLAWANIPTDVDVLVMGPTADDFSAFDPSYYGPYTLETVGGSTNTNVRDGVWLFQTSTGGAEEMVAAPYAAGLHLLALHSVNFAGADFAEGISGRVGTMTVSPSPIEAQLRRGLSSQTQVSLVSSVPLSGLAAEGFGPGRVDVLPGQTVRQDNPDDLCTASYRRTLSLNHAARLDVSTGGSPGNDIDLYLLYDGNGDGTFDCPAEIVDGSFTPTDVEQVVLRFPPDGDYAIFVHGWSVPAGEAAFTLTINAIQGTLVSVTDLPVGPIEPGVPYQFNVTYDATGLTPGDYRGVIMVGPEETTRGIVEIPIIINVLHGR